MIYDAHNTLQACRGPQDQTLTHYLIPLQSLSSSFFNLCARDTFTLPCTTWCLSTAHLSHSSDNAWRMAPHLLRCVTLSRSAWSDRRTEPWCTHLTSHLTTWSCSRLSTLSDCVHFEPLHHFQLSHSMTTPFTLTSSLLVRTLAYISR